MKYTCHDLSRFFQGESSWLPASQLPTSLTFTEVPTPSSATFQKWLPFKTGFVSLLGVGGLTPEHISPEERAELGLGGASEAPSPRLH